MELFKASDGIHNMTINDDSRALRVYLIHKTRDFFFFFYKRK